MVYLSCMKKLIIMAVIFTACQSKEAKIKEAIEISKAVEAQKTLDAYDAERKKWDEDTAVTKEYLESIGKSIEKENNH